MCQLLCVQCSCSNAAMKLFLPQHLDKTMQRKRGKNSDLCIYELLGEREKTITKEKFEFYKTIGSTMLSKNELRRMLAELGKEVSEEELLEMIYSADANGHGYVSYDSFLHIVEQFKLWQEETVSSQIGLTYDQILKQYRKHLQDPSLTTIPWDYLQIYMQNNFGLLINVKSLRGSAQQQLTREQFKYVFS